MLAQNRDTAAAGLSTTGFICQNLFFFVCTTHTHTPLSLSAVALSSQRTPRLVSFSLLGLAFLSATSLSFTLSALVVGSIDGVEDDFWF